MKITGVNFVKLCGSLEASYRDYERVARPLDCYEEFAQKPVHQMVDEKTGRVPVENIFMIVATDTEHTGIYGPIMEGIIGHVCGMIEFLTGRDPSEIQTIWELLYKLNRHGRTGYSMLAISAIDCALWDLKGKSVNQPVYKLLGGRELPVKAYASTLGYSHEHDVVIQKVKHIMEMGYTAQKWFFRYGPTDGAKGIDKNMVLAHTVRDTCGKNYPIMFDAWMGWDVPYTKTMLRELEAVCPLWLEEPLMPNDLEGYKRIKGNSSVAIAAGEHLYTRWDFKPFLDNGLLDIVQADPTWTGGITELKKIGDLCELYGVQLIPHGCTTPAGTHVSTAISPSVTPYMEFLIPYQERQQLFQLKPLFPKNGMLYPVDSPGLALELDYSKSESVKRLYKNEWRECNEDCNA